MPQPRMVIRDILRVDHAGEYGAIRIYRAQLAVARRAAPDVVALIEHALADEQRHRITFEDALGARGERPCRLLPFWGLGGSLLGGVTGLLGRTAILICTEAVERTVHRHMDDQIAWLRARDPALADAIAAIRDEEVDHLDRATNARDGASGFAGRSLGAIIAVAVETLVWTSTYGASSRLRRWLAHAKP